ncbi:hypothetical protein BJ322DRAFT_1103897 [Thelephora terrestris]|uniref:Uncharacterized protein n=1 Tax=Thelephora terrestris TaxID=56493 RepID=A0A9P6HJW2_9AGAM|nr:hypothetical protein BJ322DRAFT_1106713 [Thelephora terrestris]KAF9793514.1 hypothetical protein BJ322DRAFT_1103897 [Thelephora terrestris]
MQGGEQSDEPLLRRSSRRRRQNINRREAFTLTEAQVERARADASDPDETASHPDETASQPEEASSNPNQVSPNPQEPPSEILESHTHEGAVPTSMTASSLFENLFTYGTDWPGPMESSAEDPPAGEQRSSCSPLPLFLEGSSVLDRRSPSPAPDLFPEHSSITGWGPPSPVVSLPVNEEEEEEERQTVAEMRAQFGWLVQMIRDNQDTGWGTAYRDFVDSVLLLHAVEALGIKVRSNNRISKGEFCTSAGGRYPLTLDYFIDSMGLTYSSTTWRNKLTMYNRIMSLQSYVEHRGGASFGLDAHRAAWSVVGLWVGDRDKLLPVDWTTTRYGNTELKPLLSAMVQEANQGGLEYAEES